MRRPLLSVVIPTWNRARLVCEAVDSALVQRADGIQVIVVDDSSTDGTVAVLERRFGARIDVVCRASRGGSAAARNAGVQRARGELVAFLDSDDVWLPGKLDAELTLLERWPEADVILTDNVFFEEGARLPDTRFGSSRNGLLAATGGRPAWLHQCPPTWARRSAVSTCCMLVRAGAIEREGGAPYREDLPSHEDWDFEIRLFGRCRVAVLPRVWAHVRAFDDGTRPDRAMPGTAATRAQRESFLRGRLLVLQDAVRMPGLRPRVRAELERSRSQAIRDLERFERSER